MRISSVIASLGCLFLGCRSSNNSNPVDGAGNGDGGGSGFVKIQAIQSDAMPAGTPVAVQGVVVTAIDSFGGKTGNIWIEEPEGGPLSGVLVYNAPITDVASLNVGDLVTITDGQKADFALTGSNADTTGRTDTEIEAVSGGKLSVTKTGTGTVPAPATVDALSIGMISDADAQGSNFSAAWKMWDGVLVTVTNVSALSAPKSFGSTTPTPADNYDFGITGVAKVEGSLTDITQLGIARASCLGSVTGVVDYFYDYLILPRSPADISVASSASGCPMPETACSDGVDNDGDGFSDCADDNCIVTAGMCRATTTINAIDTATTLPTGGLELGSTESVCVIAVFANNTNFWVAKTGAAAAGEGLYVYSGGQTLPAGIAANSRVDLIGTVANYKSKLLELDLLQATSSVGACAVTPITGQTAATLTGSGAGPYVGSLVTLVNVQVTSAANSANYNIAQLSQAGTTFEAEADVHVLTSAVNTCFSSITGIWTYDIYNGVYALEPTAEGTLGGTCP